MMKLYKDEKINPMGGCLPMLLQLPLLYGLFMVFRSTIEFRQAPFTLWIHDLSMPDFIFPLGFHLPLYGDHFAVLPVLMAVTTFYQSKSTMTDPNQKAMLYMMPVMMLLIFNTLPSGLNLYYSLFNIWTLIQQWITPFPSASTAAAKSDD
jgi:YidC/Oxa1 family membrane protein insertase